MLPAATWWRTAAELGVLSVIALGLVYWLTQIEDLRLVSIQADSAKAAESAKSAHESMQRAEAMMAEFAKHSAESDERQTQLLYQICISVARTPAQMAGCYGR